jgi:hypothetical protein
VMAAPIGRTRAGLLPSITLGRERMTSPAVEAEETGTWVHQPAGADLAVGREARTPRNGKGAGKGGLQDQAGG